VLLALFQHSSSAIGKYSGYDAGKSGADSRFRSHTELPVGEEHNIQDLKPDHQWISQAIEMWSYESSRRIFQHCLGKYKKLKSHPSSL
jgi:hypothetical protein